jgi:hypothetical protein
LVFLTQCPVTREAEETISHNKNRRQFPGCPAVEGGDI